MILKQNDGDMIVTITTLPKYAYFVIGLTVLVTLAVVQTAPTAFIAVYGSAGFVILAAAVLLSRRAKQRPSADPAPDPQPRHNQLETRKDRIAQITRIDQLVEPQTRR